MAIESIFPDKASDTSSSYEVGDMRNSIKSYLGEEWVLCDGRKVDESLYPEISQYLEKGNALEESYSSKYLSDSNTVTPGGIYYHNGVWCMVGYVYHTTASKATYYPYSYHTTDPSGEWKETKMGNSTSYITDVCYHDGLWVACGYDKSSHYGRIWYSDNLDNGWTEYTATSKMDRFSCIHYHDGMWVIGGTYVSYESAIYYTTDIKSKSWTRVSLSSYEDYNGIISINYVNGYWVAGCKGAGGIFYTTDPSGTWSQMPIGSNISTLSGMNHISYYDNKYVVISGRGGSGGSPLHLHVYYTPSLNTQLTGRTTILTNSSAYRSPNVSYNNGLYTILSIYDGYNTLSYTRNPLDAWTIKQISQYTTTNEILSEIYTTGDQTVMVGYNGSTFYPYITYTGKSEYIIPTINNISDINTFIKVKSSNSGYNLPSGYMLLDYIESSGTQYIDTGFTPNQDTRAVLDLWVTNNASGNVALFGARQGTKVTTFAVWLGDGVVNPQYGSIAYNTKTLTLDYATRLTYDMNKTAFSVNGQTVTFASETFSAGCNLTLLSVNTAGAVDTRISVGKLYSCKLYDNGTLIRDYIPVMNEFGVAGLWDLVEKKFYGSATSTAFIAGNILA